MLMGGSATLLEVDTGRLIGLFDIFSFVVVCDVCKAIREEMVLGKIY
jgi:hypothetical protein